MRRITLIDIDWNIYNGYNFYVLYINAGSFDGKLFGVSFSKDYFIISLAFFQFEIRSPLYKS